MSSVVGKRISMRKLAELAGVSHMTVSLALRNHPSIAKETRERIQRIADAQNYRPDPMVARVMSKLRFESAGGHVLGYITQFGDFPWLSHRVYGAVFRGASKAAETLGYKMEVFEVGKKGLSGARLRQILYTRAISGLIVVSNPEHMGHISFDLTPFSVVQLGTGIVRPVLHRVTSHAPHNLEMALRALRRAGAGRIGLVMDRRVDTLNEHAWSATLSTFQQAVPAMNRVPALISEDLNFACFKKWFQRHRPDGIACIESRMLEWIAELGLRSPEEVQVVALDLHPSDQGFAGINQNHERIGSTALEMLLGQIYVNEKGIPEVARTTMIDGSWVDGPSCLYSSVKQKTNRARNRTGSVLEN
ncbi:MAG: LacI family DNA-binding transcriptional regulator [Verrucomicrobiia bacterium]